MYISHIWYMNMIVYVEPFGVIKHGWQWKIHYWNRWCSALESPMKLVGFPACHVWLPEGNLGRFHAGLDWIGHGRFQFLDWNWRFELWDFIGKWISIHHGLKLRFSGDFRLILKKQFEQFSQTIGKMNPEISSGNLVVRCKAFSMDNNMFDDLPATKSLGFNQYFNPKNETWQETTNNGEITWFN